MSIQTKFNDIAEIVRLIDKPEIKEEVAQWFHEKWNIPLAAYKESMEDCLAKRNSVPQWYVAREDNRIIGGLGVIENDFHDRKDLTPNVCAVYVEEKACLKIGGIFCGMFCRGMKALNICCGIRYMMKNTPGKMRKRWLNFS